jgi:MoaA/NifB/PqqE/SkfB family radical SAM enzyme
MSGPSKKTEKLVLFTGFSCNSHCHFCIDLNKRDIPDKSTGRLLEEMARAKALGAEVLELIGGEATIRGDFLGLLRAARRLGFRDVVVVSNGRMFAYPDFARQAVEAGLTDLVLSIHGPDAALHDQLTAAPGSFDQLLDGIGNLRALGFDRLYANCAVVRQNAERLPEIGRLFLRLGLGHAEFIFVDPSYGGAYAQFDALVPPLASAAAHMRETLDLGRAAGTRDWTVRYVPLCHFLGYEDQVSELRERAQYRTRHWAPEFTNPDVGGTRPLVSRLKTERCRGCLAFDRCEGLWTEYVRRRGDAELRPILHDADRG